MKIDRSKPLGVRADEHALALEILVIEIGRLVVDAVGANARETLDARMALRHAALEHADLRPMTLKGIEQVTGRILDQIREPVTR